MTIDELTRLYEAATRVVESVELSDPCNIGDILYERKTGFRTKDAYHVAEAFPALRDELLALRAENAKLREACQPLLVASDHTLVGDLKAIAAALTKGQANG